VVAVVVTIAAVGWLVATADVGAAGAHTNGGPATPSNYGRHPWRTDGCTTGPIVRVNAVPGAYDFTHACAHHDGCYKGFPKSTKRNAKPTSWKTRLECDEAFLADMRASCDELFARDPSRASALATCQGYAVVYYQAVRTLGAFAYKGPSP
jgi:hypothetical protein